MQQTRGYPWLFIRAVRRSCWGITLATIFRDFIYWRAQQQRFLPLSRSGAGSAVVFLMRENSCDKPLAGAPLVLGRSFPGAHREERGVCGWGHR